MKFFFRLLPFGKNVSKIIKGQSDGLINMDDFNFD